MTLRRPRGFVLVVVLMIALAAAAIAVALTTTGGDARLRSVRAEHTDLSEGIAHAGMQRAKAYANTAAPSGGDYDLLLDPGLAANCAGLPGTAPTCPTCGRPNFADGGAVTYRGKSYERVPFNGGAYLIRYDDDNDDQQTSAVWDLNDNNNGCDEGTSLSGLDNPVRDRNRTIIITAIGISPGTNPDTAQHRTVLRMTHSNNSAGTTAGIQMQGSINVNGSADLYACSPVGRIEVDGLFSSATSGDACACGNSLTDAVGGWTHCSATPADCAGVGCASGAIATPGPALPPVPPLDSAAGKNFYFDWSKPCTFYVNEAGNKSLWVWDATSLRGPGGALCSNFAGDGSAPTLGDATPPDPAADSYKRCWTPLLLEITATPVGCVSPWAVAGVPPLSEGLAGGPGVCEWMPNGNVSATMTVAQINAVAGILPFGGAGLGAATFNKPAWATACQVTFPTTPATGCDPLPGAGCDGTVGVFANGPGTRSYMPRGASAAELRGVPAGVYVYSGDINFGSGAANMTPQPATLPPVTITQWPLATLVTTGNVSGSGSGKNHVGTGIDIPTGARFPSIVANGLISFTNSGDQMFLGSIYSTNSVTRDNSGDTYLFGEIHLNGSMNVSGSGSFNWRYTTPFGAAAGGAVGIPAVIQSFE